jgi:hypothetical protein
LKASDSPKPDFLFNLRFEKCACLLVRGSKAGGMKQKIIELVVLDFQSSSTNVVWLKNKENSGGK